MKDIASVVCTDTSLEAKIRAIKVYQFRPEQERRAVISALWLIYQIQKLDKGISVEQVGEQDTLIQLVKGTEQTGFLVWMKVTLVAMISFFGTAFTIMAFHNDIGIHAVFGKVYEQIMGETQTGITGLEIAYSIGLAVGITLFFNHIGGRRITKDPTPIEVEMRIYEKDVDDTLVETADREGKIVDAP